MLLHSDGIEIYNVVCYRVFQWYSATNYGCNIYDSRFYIVMVPENELAPETISDLVEYFDHVDIVLTSGVRPWRDYKQNPFQPKTPQGSKAGAPLAGGWCASFVGWQGDSKENVSIYNLSQNYQCNQLCEFCCGHRV